MVFPLHGLDGNFLLGFGIQRHVDQPVSPVADQTQNLVTFQAYVEILNTLVNAKTLLGLDMSSFIELKA